MANAIENNLLDVHGLLKQGKFMEAMEKHLHDDVQLIEGNSEPKVGKEHCLAFEQDFIDTKVKEFVGYEVGDYAVNGDNTFYTAVMTLNLNDGTTMKVDQVVHSEWKDGKIIRERFYHNG